MQERCEETVSIHEGAEGNLIAEVAAMELSGNKEVDVKQGKEEKEMQSCWKERMHHHHGHGHGHHLRHHHHGHHLHPHHHVHHSHPHPHPHHHHMEKKWEKLEKKRMKMCGQKKKGSEGWNSKFVGKMKHKLEKIDWKIESLQEKKLFILRRIQEIEEEEEKKKKNETPLPTDAAANLIM